MVSHVYNVVKAPIGWALFCDRERVGGFVSSEAALEAATAFGANAIREGHSIQINVPGPELREIEGFELWPARWNVTGFGWKGRSRCRSIRRLLVCTASRGP